MMLAFVDAGEQCIKVAIPGSLTKTTHLGDLPYDIGLTPPPPPPSRQISYKLHHLHVFNTIIGLPTPKQYMVLNYPKSLVNSKPQI